MTGKGGRLYYSQAKMTEVIKAKAALGDGADLKAFDAKWNEEKKMIRHHALRRWTARVYRAKSESAANNAVAARRREA